MAELPIDAENGLDALRKRYPDIMFVGILTRLSNDDIKERLPLLKNSMMKILR